MSAHAGAHVARKRLLKAMAVVVAMVLAAPASDALVQAVGGKPQAEGLFGGIDAAAIVGADDALDAVDLIERAAQQGRGSPSDSFLSEVGLLAHARDVRVYGEGQVVGYMVDCRAEEAMARIDEQMQKRGWSAVPLGGIDGATYVKNAGAYRWVLVNCPEIGSATSVVVRCAQA